MAKTCFVVVNDQVDNSFSDLVRGIRTFCPEADIAWYYSGPRRRELDGLITVPRARPLKYAKITPAFFDVLEWAAEQDYDHIVNVETDMTFIRPGFLRFVEGQMQDVDYLAPRLRRRTPAVSQWPAYRSLRSELPELLSLLGMTYTNRCFNPGQVFSRRYASAVVSSDIYPALRGFVERNQRPGRSNTLQELILPTLADRFELSSRTYPDDLAVFNRYRPFQGTHDLALARDHPDAYFLHPVRREDDDPVRVFSRALLDEQAEPTTTGDGMPEKKTDEPIPQQATATAGKDLSKAALQGENLSDADLVGANLREATLSGAFLASADLRGADLSMSFLGGAFLKSALLNEADLAGASLHGTDLREVDLSGAFLNGADLRGAFLGDADLRNADLRDTNLAGADLREANLGGADLSRADLRGALLTAAKWTNTTTWPDRYREAVRAASHDEGDGRFVVRDDGFSATDIRLEHPYRHEDRPGATTPPAG